MEKRFLFVLLHFHEEDGPEIWVKIPSCCVSKKDRRALSDAGDVDMRTFRPDADDGSLMYKIQRAISKLMTDRAYVRWEGEITMDLRDDGSGSITLYMNRNEYPEEVLGPKDAAVFTKCYNAVFC